MFAKRQSTRDNSIESRKRSSIKESDFFSLNLRMLAIRKLQEKDDLHTVDASMVWQRLSAGYRIVDLRLNRFMQTLHFVLTYFCRTEPLFKAVGLSDDAVSVKMFMNGVFKHMENMISFCAVKEGTNDLVGVLVASMFEKSQWYIKKELYSIVKHVLQGETLRQVMTLKNYVTAKAQRHEMMNVGGLVWIDILCVKPEHQNNGIGTALVRSCMARASYLETACAGQFTCGAAQTIARRLNFQTLYEIPYEHLHKEKSKFKIFGHCHPENYSIACMAVRVSRPKLQLPMAPGPTYEENRANDRAKANKKRKKAKKKE